MSDVDKFIKKMEEKTPGFAAKIDQEIENYRIGEEIRNLRLSKGMTQEELANKLSTTKSAISRLENHSESVRLSTLEKVADIFNKKIKVSFL